MRVERHPVPMTAEQRDELEKERAEAWRLFVEAGFQFTPEVIAQNQRLDQVMNRIMGWKRPN